MHDIQEGTSGWMVAVGSPKDETVVRYDKGTITCAQLGNESEEGEIKRWKRGGRWTDL